MGCIVLLAYPAACWKALLVEWIAPNTRWKALGRTPGVCLFSPRSDILTVRRRFRKVYGSQLPPPVTNIHHYSVCCHLHCTYCNKRVGDLLFRIGSSERHMDSHYALEQWVWGSLEVREEDLWLRDHWLRGFEQLKWMRKNMNCPLDT